MGPDPYVRQRALGGFGPEGQRALSEAAVVVIGVGGLGCPAALALAAAGVGELVLVDSDHVSITNLHRQTLYGPDDVGSLKVVAAERALRRIAPGLRVTAVSERLTEASAQGLLCGSDAVLDCTDNFEARYAVADAAAASGVPVVWGAVQGWHGQVTVFDTAVGLRDVFPEPPRAELGACEGGAVMGPVCAQVGSAMATEAIKAVTGAGETLAGTIAMLDGRSGRWRDIAVARSRQAVGR
ncbi:HesA/MoeB/ThiF family protein [Demequina lignilytica]|uniref:HesA/MoeB/ThiF family protein n=1 Tax=Demequina lignilytica TaxID=3051663 RepID=A0AB35MF62_9MICO|nr:HesA/MoeB/ThiF family protein [Demequina sp. SYSU T0a273]MDN4482413.1 HesA/MoeB/ThiF family protein [Demequina sp. SYSU T0a273]